MPGLATQRTDVGRTSILWAASPRAPIAVHNCAEHAAVIWGDALLASSAGRAAPRDVAASWLDDRSAPAVFDGFYAAAAATPDGRVAVGADVLGYFPVYYAALGDVLLAGASPEPFRHHPAFAGTLSLEGLLNVLMFGGAFEGPSLLDGVRRLRTGRLLTWRPGEPPVEAEHYAMPTDHRHASRPTDEQLEILHAAHVRSASRHHPPNESCGLLLTGGLDSRFVAAYLHAQGSDVRSLTFGRLTDYEAECAAAVAGELRIPHQVRELPVDRFVEFATQCATWEHLGSGMGTLHMWGAADALNRLPARSGSGYNRGREQPYFPTEFHALCRVLTRRAIPAETLRTLVRRPEALDIIDGLVERFEIAYHRPDDSPAERAWRLFSDSHVRHYVAGVLWRQSFGSWPVLLELDREFLDDWLGVPIDAMAGRVLVEALMRRRFPRLARLPLDINAHTTRVIAPTFTRRAGDWMLRHAPEALRTAHIARRQGGGDDRRHYYRMYDFDNSGWRAIREAAEPHRALLFDYFDRESVNRLLPGPQMRGTAPDPMADGFTAKLLLGLIFWLRDHT